MAVTIKDIAKKTNVSIATVSRVMNNKNEGASEETRRRITEAIKELGYQPNALARGLVTRKTKTIGLIIPDIANPFFPDIARGVEDCANKHGYSVFLCNTDDSLVKESQYIRALEEKCVDGIVFTSNSIPKQEHIIELIRNGIPVVLLDRWVEVEGGYGVFLDNLKGGYIAARHLIELGHRRIACIAGPLHSKTAKDRLEGYKKALLEEELPIDESIIVEGNYKINSGFNAAEKLMDKGITGIIAFNDLMAYGACNAIKAKGYRIPEDISVIGFDDIIMSQMMEPQLTTIKQPSYEMGTAAIKMLIKLIEGKKINKKVICFEPDLIIRRSAGRLKE
jgi:LacI family transcriptional regulator